MEKQYIKNGYSIQRNEIFEIPHRFRKDIFFHLGTPEKPEPVILRREPDLDPKDPENVIVSVNGQELLKDKDWKFDTEDNKRIIFNPAKLILREIDFYWVKDGGYDAEGNLDTSKDADGNYTSFQKIELGVTTIADVDPEYSGSVDPTTALLTSNPDAPISEYLLGDPNLNFWYNGQADEKYAALPRVVIENRYRRTLYTVDWSFVENLKAGTAVIRFSPKFINANADFVRSDEEGYSTVKLNTSDRIEVTYVAKLEKHERPGFLYQFAQDCCINPFDPINFDDNVTEYTKDSAFRLVYPNIIPMKTTAQATEEGLAAGDFIEVSDSEYPTENEKYAHARANLPYIRDMVILESDSGVDPLSDSNIKPSPAEPTEGPQNWRIRMRWNRNTDYLEVHVATKFQILDDGRLTAPEKVAGYRTVSIRQPGELCDIYKEPNSDTIGNYSLTDPETSQPIQSDALSLRERFEYFPDDDPHWGSMFGELESFPRLKPEYEYYLNNANAPSGAVYDFKRQVYVPLIFDSASSFWNPDRYFLEKSTPTATAEDVHSLTAARKLQLIKSKTGFFKRNGKHYYDVAPTYPMSYRLTITGYGIGLYLWEQDSADEDTEYAWFVIQRHVDGTTGEPHISHKAPVHCVYSPAKKPFDITDLPIFYDSDDLLNRNAISDIYDGSGNSLTRPTDEIIPFKVDEHTNKLVIPDPKVLESINNWNVLDVAKNMSVTLNGVEINPEPLGKMIYDPDSGDLVPNWKDISNEIDAYGAVGTSINTFIYDETEHVIHLREYLEPDTSVVIKYRVPKSQDSLSKRFMIQEIADPDFPEYNMNKTKTINRFVVREKDVWKPWDHHKSATMNEIDSHAIINPMEQMAITPSRDFVFTIPTNLTTQRFYYPNAELDILAYTSAEFNAFGSHVEVAKYLDNHLVAQPDGSLVAEGESGIIQDRVYEGYMSTLPNGNGMRIFFLVKNGPILDSDVTNVSGT